MNAILVLLLMISVLAILPAKLQFYIRLFAAFVSMCACASLGVLVSIVLTILRKRALSQWMAGRVFAYVTNPLIGLKVEFRNEEYVSATRPSIVVGNHQSEMDVLLLGRIFPRYCSVTAKSSLKYVPFLGWFMLFSGTVFIDRQNRGQAIRALDGAIKRMEREQLSVFIFPEGTRSYFTTPDLLPFKRGAFHLAIQSGFPVVPVVISNYASVFSFKNRVLQPGTVVVQALEPIETAGMTADDVDSLMHTTRERMLATLKAISPKPPAADVDAEDTTLLDADGEATAADTAAATAAKSIELDERDS